MADGWESTAVELSHAKLEASVDSPDRAAYQRSQFLRALTDLVVLPGTQLSANERSLVADMIMEVYGHVEPSIRFDLAERVARVPDAPPVLVREILFDDPEVAVPFIQKAEQLPDVLLAECARKCTEHHRLAIARRIDLTAHVADAILEHSEVDVAKLLLRRQEFALSPYAIDLLLVRSSTDPESQLLLLQRPELEPAHGFIMFWWVDSERRKRILSRFAINRAKIQDAVQELYGSVMNGPGSDPKVSEILTVLDRRFRPRGANGKEASLEIIARTLRATRTQTPDAVLPAVSLISGTSKSLVDRILRDPGGEPFAVLCKATGLPRDEFYQIANTPTSVSPLSPERADDLLGVFDSMSRDFARAVLRYWDWEGNPRIAQIVRLIGLSRD